MTNPDVLPSAEVSGAQLHLPSLLLAVVLMLVGSVVPVWFSGSDGQPMHGFLMAYLWSMSAGFVRGVGYRPSASIWRWTFSGWACLAALVLALVARGLGV